MGGPEVRGEETDGGRYVDDQGDAGEPGGGREAVHVVNLVGPNEAVIFSALDANPQYQDIDDDFFELSLDEVKTMYRDLRSEVKRLTEEDMLMTAALVHFASLVTRSEPVNH